MSASTRSESIMDDAVTSDSRAVDEVAFFLSGGGSGVTVYRPSPTKAEAEPEPAFDEPITRR